MSWLWGVLAAVILFLGVCVIIGLTNDYSDMADYLRDREDEHRTK